MGMPKPSPPNIPMPPPSAHPPTLGSSTVNAALATQKAGAAAEIMGGTEKTSPQGLKTKPSTAQATLLGQ